MSHVIQYRTLYKNIKIEDHAEVMDSNMATVGKQLFLMTEPVFMDLPRPTDMNQVQYLNCSPFWIFSKIDSAFMEKLCFL